MTFSDLTTLLSARGIDVSARLRVDAPAGSLTPALRDALHVHKGALLQRLVRDALWAELATQRWAGADDSPGIVIAGL